VFVRVSLLRRKLFADLDLPATVSKFFPRRHFHADANGDYLWRVNDHGKTMRELRATPLRRRSLRGIRKAMLQMCRFVKPILAMVPLIDNTESKDLFKCSSSAGASRTSARGQVQPGQLMT